MSEKHTLKKFGTDIERLRNMKDEDIDFSDIPKTTPEMWEKGFVRNRRKSENSSDNFTIDSDIIEFFKKQKGDYRENINRLLREYVENQTAEKV